MSCVNILKLTLAKRELVKFELEMDMYRLMMHCDSCIATNSNQLVLIGFDAGGIKQAEPPCQRITRRNWSWILERNLVHTTKHVCHSLHYVVVCRYIPCGWWNVWKGTGKNIVVWFYVKYVLSYYERLFAVQLVLSYWRTVFFKYCVNVSSYCKTNIGPPYKIDRLIESGDINNIYCKYLRNRANSVLEYRTLFFSKRDGCTNVASRYKLLKLHLMVRSLEKTPC